MKNIFSSIAIFFVAIFLFAGCLSTTKVENGFTGIEARNYGGEKGGIIEHTPGRVWYNPWTVDFYEFPNYVQTETWTQDNGDALKVLSGNQLEFVVDVGLSYFVNPYPGCSAEIFRKYRKDIQDITNGPIRLTVRDEVQAIFSQSDADFIYGEGRVTIVDEVKALVTQSLTDLAIIEGQSCFVVDDLYLTRLEPPQTVKAAVEAKVAETQRAQQAVESTKRIEEEAKQAQIRADMEALNNRKISESLTPEILRNKWIEKWDGKLPQYVGGDDATVMLGVGN